jgi:hypothetical protein
MKTYTTFMAPGYTKMEIRTLLERVTPELKKQVLDQIELVDKDEVLKNVLEAIQKDVMGNMLREKAADAKITMNVDLFIDSVISIINKTGDSAEDQVTFLRDLLDGKVIDCIKMVKDSLNKVVKMDSYVKTKSPLWPKVKDKLIALDIKIDNQNIGPGEILYIISTPGGKKGDEENKGDCWLASGVNVELKKDGGTFSKPTKFADARLAWINAFKDLGRDLSPADADKMGLGGTSIYGESNKGGGIANALSIGSKDYTSLYMDNKSVTQGVADKACESLYAKVCAIACPNNGALPYTFKKTVKNGLTDPNEFIRQWNANALHDYKVHGWDYLTLFNADSGDTISFMSAQDLYKSKQWNVGSEWMLRWTGGGGFGGTGSSTRVYAGTFKNIATYDPGDTDFEKKVAEKNEIRKALEHAFGQLSNKKNSGKIKAAFSKANDLKGPMNDLSKNNEPKDFKPLVGQIGQKISDYFQAKKELNFGRDKSDRDLGKSFADMKRKLGVR